LLTAARLRVNGLVRNWPDSETIMARDLTLSELERCLSTVVCELREQHDIASRVHDMGFARTKTVLLESSLSTYQWLAVERMLIRDHPHDVQIGRTDRR
jgi:hypothetical protein